MITPLPPWDTADDHKEPPCFGDGFGRSVYCKCGAACCVGNGSEEFWMQRLVPWSEKHQGEGHGPAEFEECANALVATIKQTFPDLKIKDVIIRGSQ